MTFNVYKIKKHISEFCIALILTANILSQAIRSDGFFGVIVLVAFISFILLNPLKRNTLQNFFPHIIRIILLITVAFATLTFTILYYGFNAEIKNILSFFCLVGITSLYLSLYKFDYIQVLNKIAIISIIYVFFFIRMDFTILGYGGESHDYTGYLMMTTYGILPFLLSESTIFKTSNSKFIKILSSISFAPYFFFLIVFGSRGAWVAFFLYVPLFFIIYKNKNVNIFRLFGVISILYVLFSFLFYLLINNVFSNSVYDSYFVQKLINLTEEGDLSSGRMDIYKYTWNKILKSPIWGYGVGSYDNFSGAYPHNFILQLLYEGGILLCFPILFILFKSIYIIGSSNYNIEQRIFIMFLFMNSVVRLFLSYNLWMSQFFWLLIGLTIQISYSQKNKKR